MNGKYKKLNMDTNTIIEWLEKVLQYIKLNDLDTHWKTLYRILDCLRYRYCKWSIWIDNEFYHEWFNKEDLVYREDYYGHISYYDFDEIISRIY